MKKGVALLLIFFTVSVSAQQLKNDFFSYAQQFLSKYVNNGKVNYEAVKKDSVFVNNIMSQIDSFAVRKTGRNSREAFYLNAYNILVIKSLADNYPVKSAYDIPGFFDVQTHNIGGEKLTLDEIEKVKIGDEYRDPRVHFWLNPAATGSPPVSNKAIMLHNLNELLDEQAKSAMNNNEYIGIDPDHKEVLVPMLFKINESDFTQDGKTILDFINTYRKKKINPGYQISYYFFNRDLNDLKDKSKTRHAIEEKRPSPEIVKTAPLKADTVIEKPAEKPAEKLPEKEHQDTVMTNVESVWNDDILSPGSYMLTSIFQVRAYGSLNTQHANYNGELNRINSDFRTSNFNFTVQCWNRITDRVNYGVQLTFRSLVISDFNSSPYNALSFSNTKNSKFYFRDVSNSVKYLFCEGKYRVTGISSLIVPGSKNNVVKYGNDSLFDNGQTQWFNQLLLVRRVSKYFTLNAELNAAMRFNAANAANRFIVRSSLLPEFNYWFSRSFRFYAFCELNPQLNHGFFSSFYFREGAGITIIPGKISQWDFQYHYFALGKRTVATSSFILGARFNF